MALGLAEALPGTYDPRLVALSIVIASSASYTAFTLAERVTASQARARLLWLIGGATTMGTGIWSMHFTGMLAFQLPIPVSYSLPIVLLSLLVAIAASGSALAVVSQPNLSIRLWLLGGLLLGAGVGTMHYIGMAAMRMNAMAHWDPRIVVLSFVIAVAVSLVALWLVFHLRAVTTRRGAWQRGIAAGFMGVAIAGMHYTGMAAASFTAMPMPVRGTAVVSAASLGSSAVALVTVLILSLALGIAFIDRRFAAQEQALAESRQHFRTVVANAPVSLLALDAAGTITLAQGRGLAALGHTSEEMMGCSLFEVFAGVPELVQQGHRALAGEELMGFSSVRDLVLETRWTPEIDELGQVTGVIAVATDVTDRHRAETALHASEERFRMLVQHSSDITMVVDMARTITYISPSVEAILGYTPTDLLGRPVHTLLHREDLPLLEEFRAGIPDTGEAHLITERRLRHRDGTWRYVEAITTNLLHVPSVGGVVINAREITERKAFEQQLQHQAFHDPLTTLPNRALFMDRLEHALARQGRQQGLLAVLFLDLDRFKVVNDSLGHDAGDQLLIAVAARMQRHVRQEDTVARFGGDEFAILLSDVADVNEAVRMAERLITALDPPFRLGEHEVVAATSIGITISSPVHRVEDLLRDADVALYRAKARGRYRYEVYDETMNARALERLELETDLRLALERGEFEVYYQPKVTLATGRLIGMEALVRWRHPRRGLVPPAEFIPLAEETGIIRPLGQWILDEVCRQAKIWQAQAQQDAPLITSVNLSARQFQHPALVAEVARSLVRSGVDPHGIQLEITESVAMGNAETTVATLHQLKELGVQLAIDDFGTGYSSLAYLKRFPVDSLKIDRAFVSGLLGESEDASIIHAVVSLGHALNLSVVAEGVETAEEAAHVAALGCDLGQGYYFALPLPRDQASALIIQERHTAAALPDRTGSRTA